MPDRRCRVRWSGGELSRLGSAIGSAVSNDYSAVSLVSTRGNFDRVWEIFAEVMLNPAFNPTDIDLNRERILTGLRESGTSPESALETIQNNIIFAGHPYANDVSGTVANISRFTPAELREYHKSVMQTSRLLFVFVGDLDPDQLKVAYRGDIRKASARRLQGTSAAGHRLFEGYAEHNSAPAADKLCSGRIRGTGARGT